MAAGFVLRSIDLKADPPSKLSWSSAIYSDEAHNAYSARNWVLYGRWQVDDYIPYVVYPWLNLFTGIVFRIAGIGLVQLKIASLLAGLLLIIAMYFLGRSVSRRAGTIAAIVTASSYCLVMYSRLGLAEMTQVLMVAATIAFLARAARSRAAAALSGACALFAILFVKVSAVYLLAAALLLIAYELTQARLAHSKRKELAGTAAFWLLGGFVPMVVWLIVVFIPHHATYLSYVLGHSFGATATFQGGHPKTIPRYLLNLFSIGSWSNLYDRFPILAAVGYLALPSLVPRTGRASVFSALVLLAGAAMLGYVIYHPPRYELFTLIPMIVGFAFAVDRLIDSEVRIGHPWPHLAGAVLYTLWLWPLAAQVTFRLAKHRDGTNGAAIAALAAALVASFAFWGLHRLTRGGVWIRGRLLRYGIAAALLLLVVGRDVKLYSNWYRARTHIMYESSRTLDWILPDSSATGGFWAPAMLSTSHKRAVFISDQWDANLVNPIERFGLTHLVVTGDDEFYVLDSITSGRASQARLLGLCPVNDLVIAAVLELTPPSLPNPVQTP